MSGTMKILASAAVVILLTIVGLWYGSKNNDMLRGIKLAMLLPGHRAALLSQCSSMPAPSSANAGSLPINVTRWGETGAGMLVIHGGVQGSLGGGPSTFAKQEVLSRQGWRMMLPERPGFGKSPSRGADDMEGDAVWISEMLNGVVLVGHSFGGAEALLAAARRPDGVRALIMVEPALHALLPRSSVLASKEDARKDFLKFGEASLASRTPAEYGLVFGRSLGEGTVGAALESDANKAASLGCALLRARMASPEALRAAAETVARAKIPVLTISGGWSPTFDAVSQLGAELTRGKHVIVQSRNHFPQLENPDLFNNVVSDFANKEARKPGALDRF